VQAVIGGTPPYLFSLAGSSLQSQERYTDLAAGAYSLTVQDQTGCHWDTLITLQEETPFLLDLGDDQEIALGCTFDIKPFFNRDLSEIDTFIWMPPIACEDCIYPVIQPLRTIAYQVQAVDINGCKAEDQLRIFVREDRNVFFPNVFSPNKDGTNDIFFVQAGKDAVEVLTFRIYNRWGTLVADVEPHLPNNPTFGWRGLINNQSAPNGVYVYQIELRFIDDVIKQYTGDLLLMR
jgi:gliding motility-associated-like protein